MTLTLSPLPPFPLDIAPTLPQTFMVGTRTYIPWIEGVEVDRDPIDVAYNVTPRQTARGRTWASGSRLPKPATLTLRLYLEAESPLAVRQLAQRWRRILTTADTYSEGARSVSISEVLSCPEAFGEGNTRLLTATLLLVDAQWRLSPDDLFPAPHPIETGPGVYPLGLLKVEDEGPGYWEVSALGDDELVTGAPLNFTTSSGQTFTLQTISIEVPSDT